MSDLFEDAMDEKRNEIAADGADLSAAERAFALLPKPPIGIPDTIETRAAWAVNDIEKYQEIANVAMTGKGRIVVDVHIGNCHIVLRSNKKTEAAIADLVLSGIETMKLIEKTGVEMQHAEEIAAKDAEIANLRADISAMRDIAEEKDAEIAALKDELAGTIKVRDQAFERIAKLRANAELSGDEIARLKAENTTRSLECVERRGTIDRQAKEISRLCDDLAAERDLVQRLADALNCFDYDGHGKFLATFGLRKVEGRWERVK